MLWCRLTIIDFSFSLLSFIFIPFFHFILLHLIFFFLILLNFLLGFNIHTLFLITLLIFDVYSFIIIVHVETLKSMSHEVFYALSLTHDGYGDCFIEVIKHVMARGLTHAFCTTFLIKRHANGPISMYFLGNMPEDSLTRQVGRGRDKCIRRALIAWKPNVLIKKYACKVIPSCNECPTHALLLALVGQWAPYVMTRHTCLSLSLPRLVEKPLSDHVASDSYMNS